jgi:hypothetical protein
MASRLVRANRANAVTVNDVLDGHKLLEIDCADRVYLTLSVPSLVVGGQVVNFLTEHERNPIPSPALLERRGQAFRRAVYSFAEANGIPCGRGRPGVPAGVHRDQGPGPTGAVWFSHNRAERRVTCYYFYLWDEGFGPYADRPDPLKRAGGRPDTAATHGNRARHVASHQPRIPGHRTRPGVSAVGRATPGRPAAGRVAGSCR